MTRGGKVNDLGKQQGEQEFSHGDRRYEKSPGLRDRLGRFKMHGQHYFPGSSFLVRGLNGPDLSENKSKKEFKNFPSERHSPNFDLLSSNYNFKMFRT